VTACACLAREAWGVARGRLIPEIALSAMIDFFNAILDFINITL
jgi:hypothetical protein